MLESRVTFSNMKIGYGRVSTDKQDTDPQQEQLLKYGCEKIFLENVSGAALHKPQLTKAIEQLREGDELVVWKLDRLSRSLKDLLLIIEEISAAKAMFTSLTEHLDTSGPCGTAMMQMIGVFAQFERAMIAERTRLGVRQAMAEGKIIGRPAKLDPAQQKEVIRLLKAGHTTQAEIARMVRVDRSVISRMVSKLRVQDRGSRSATPAPR
jgi:DNA invertase Pin-like site-specific DNA recombinase